MQKPKQDDEELDEDLPKLPLRDLYQCNRTRPSLLYVRMDALVAKDISSW